MGLAEITGRVRAAEAAAGRKPGEVRLIAVSKVQPADRVEAVLAEGHRLFGENYVQEAAAKWPAWQARYPGGGGAHDRPLADQQGQGRGWTCSTRSTRLTGRRWPKNWPGWPRPRGRARICSFR